MKYVFATWEPKKYLRQLLLDTNHTLKTKRIHGYGSGVTFSGSVCDWTRTTSTNSNDLRFFEPSHTRQHHSL
jgi:hypothetical protein